MKLSRVKAPVVSFLLLATFVQSISGQAPVDLRQASLEDLMDMTVTSVSKKEQKLSRAAAAIFVITQEDIRGSGAVNIPDLLRMAPGVDVEQINGSAWSISIRGFNSRFSNKVLVLIDGRTVYSPIFSGVYWDQLGVPLDDIDRIEVVRGPGGTVWGANAVNGVISIITKSSKDTKGGMVTAASGSQTRAVGLLQYGGSLGQGATYRAFGDYTNIGNSMAPGGAAGNDNWQGMNAGFRSDWDLSKRDSLMLQGALFSNRLNQTDRSGFIPTPYDRLFPLAVDAAGGDMLARWKHIHSGGSETSLQVYYDSYRRTDAVVPMKTATFDLDFQNHTTAGDRHDIVWGLGYRADTTSAASGYSVSFTPQKRTANLFNIFLQDEIRIADSVSLTLGAKLEHNAYTGFETEPSVRVAWAPGVGRHTLWAAASRAIRQPSRSDGDVESDVQRVPLGPDVDQIIRLIGNPHIKAEVLQDYELGYRSVLSKNLSLDVATFLSRYRDLETLEPGSPEIIPGLPTLIVIPALYQNLSHALDYGGELSLTWRASSRWRISPGYSYLHANVSLDPTSHGLPTATVSTDFPQNLFHVRSLFNLSRNMDFDQSLYYTASLPGGSIPGHARLDLRLARRIGESMEISLVGQNLLRPGTIEYGDSLGIVATQSVRSVYGKITWRF